MEGSSHLCEDGHLPLDRLRALDLAFLDLETDRAPLHVGWTLVLGGRPPSLSALRRHLESRLDAVPRFRRRLAASPLGLGDRHWADDTSFDIANHVHAVRAAAPGGTAQLREVAGVLLSGPLPLGRPLWQLHLVEGLADGWALAGKVHHALVDGVAAIEIAQLLFDGLGEDRPPRPFVPEPAEGPAGAAARAAARRVSGAAALARAAAGTVAGGGAAEAVRQAGQVADTAVRPSPATTLTGGRTDRRAVGWASTPLEPLKEAGRRHGATLNDVLLAAASAAMREALARRGEHPPGLKALVPVDVREDGEDPGPGNHISFLAIELPVGETDPVRALRRIHARTKAAKARGDARPLAALAEAADLLPGAPRRALTRIAARAASFSLVVSNVPGPPGELTLLGRPLRSVLPMVPLLDGQALTVGAVSYAGRLHVGVAADALALPDVVDVARDLERAFDALRVATGPEPLPWQARARARRARSRQRAASR